MTTLRVELEIRDYGLWRSAFDKDAGGRESSGMRRYRIFRPVDNDHQVMLDLDFDTTADAGAFLETLRPKSGRRLTRPQPRSAHRRHASCRSSTSTSTEKRRMGPRPEQTAAKTKARRTAEVPWDQKSRSHATLAKRAA